MKSSEILFIALMALVLFGPKKLSELGRQAGKMLGDFKRASEQFKAQVADEMRQMERETMPRIPEEASASVATLPGGVDDKAGRAGRERPRDRRARPDTQLQLPGMSKVRLSH